MNIEDLTFGQIKEIASIARGSAQDNPSPYVPGSVWLWRTVTHYTVGEVDRMVGQSIVLKSGACWVANTGRCHEFLRDGWGTKNVEAEPYPDGVVSVVERGAVVDAQEWPHGLGRVVLG